MTMWYSLDKKSKINRQGVLKVRVAFGTEKNNQVAEQEYRHMIRIILLHELEVSQVGIDSNFNTLLPNLIYFILRNVKELLFICLHNLFIEMSRTFIHLSS